MREIKYRIWDKEYEEFSNWTNRDPFFDVTSGKIFFWERVKREDGTYAPDVVLEEVGDRFILQQYTGLDDKDGEKIYEGDIVEGIDLNSGPAKAVVGFDTFGIYYTDISKYPQEPYEECLPFAQEYNKVIGNIFENPDLLK
jgi:uncharacterized phage protein (TIGR01671 family)